MTEPMQRPYPLAATALVLGGCGQLDTMFIDPPLRPEQWCLARPCSDLGGFVLDEPLGSLLVYSLAGLFIFAGMRLRQSRGTQRSRAWWSWSLLLGGVAAGLAGTSYQAFGYELKCSGHELCVWTNWFEVAYMALQNLSVDCMVVAVAYSCTRGSSRRLLLAYAGINAAAHLLVTAYGIATAQPFLLSFELLLLFSSPAFVVALGLNAVRYVQLRQPLDRALLGAWGWLFATNAAYYGYLLAGVTETLWRGGAGFYFSENDVLHVGMIGWVLYLHFAVVPRLRDRGAS